MAVLLVDGARMRRFADNLYFLMTNVAADAGNDARAGILLTRESRSLLDMEFEEGGDPARVDDGLSRCERLRVEPAGGDAFAERFARRAVLERKVGFLEASHHAERADIGLPEEGAFLAAHHQNAVVAKRRDALAAHAARNG